MKFEDIEAKLKEARDALDVALEPEQRDFGWSDLPYYKFVLKQIPAVIDELKTLQKPVVVQALRAYPKEKKVLAALIPIHYKSLERWEREELAVNPPIKH